MVVVEDNNAIHFVGSIANVFKEMASVDIIVLLTAHNSH